MAKKYYQGTFVPQNPQKMIGNIAPTFRSSWENHVMQFLDTHPSVIQWGSEAIKIPYKNPLTGKNTVYIPDFIIVYQDKSGNKRSEIVEVKPKKETIMEAAKTKRDKAFVVLNAAKWAACIAFCNRHGLTFRVMNEDSIFRQNGNGKKK
jgi:NAD-dependent dihydropyrimidine dehydrogenase PreA subunit